ncbi:sigma-70 family RNA polymerase sigma factor [Marivirga sp. S37H4]|uniref:Sigma-70 family RNA polymerase sigma factor n=1 Tax=Marivirga aurantiaca TaxID=2802615 RepID=A0A935C568_9BACT|nr:sigma-70 family RNA polymerase sigma factor [Marivirga aurantiaca]MBK6263649.1 sigma-70 family RNA polymerase sigma factor [Marivirga aurantiaca]
MTKKDTHPDQRYIEGLLANNSFIIRSIYEDFAPKVINYICQNNGDRDAAQDVIQEVLIIIFKQAQHKNLVLSCPFDAYFFLLCKRKWLNELKKSSGTVVTINEETTSIDDKTSEEAQATELFEEQEQLFNQMFEKLGKACKDLLKTAFQTKSMEEVAQKLNVSYAYARKKKSLCIGNLTKMIKESPMYNRIKP